jgi:hypothetical protein
MLIFNYSFLIHISYPNVHVSIQIWYNIISICSFPIGTKTCSFAQFLNATTIASIDYM